MTNEKKVQDLDFIDKICLYLYTIEVFIKAIGLGIEKYWDDDWNKFDFVLVIMSWASDIFIGAMASFKAAKTAKMSKLVKLTKLNRVFKMFRACRSIKALSFLFAGADLFGEV